MIALARILRTIPQSNEDPQAVSLLVQPDEDATFVLGWLHGLDLFGLLDWHGERVRASSQTAKYTLNSLAAYVEQQRPIVTDWKTRGLQPNPLGNGASFLHLLETQRLQWDAHAVPSRIEYVAQVVIRRNHPDTGIPEILFQYDHNAAQYQLIGGRTSPRDDHDPRRTIVREITEELPLNLLRESHEYQLTTLVEDLALPPTISPTFGALTHYHFTIFYMHDLHQELALGNQDRWLAIEAVLSDTVVNAQGAPMHFSDPTIYHWLDKAVGGLAALAQSVRKSP